jgi:xylan 1,4-beta-xylosidase
MAGATGNLNCCTSPAPPSPPVGFAIDLTKHEPLVHHWERCVGSGHGALTLREDWRKHVRMARQDLGIERVRFHGILDDDMSVSFSETETGFVNIDSTCDFLVANNMSMVMELGFMPRWLARDKTGFDCTHTINHYVGCSDPPTDYQLWGDLIYKLGTHLVERYGEAAIAERWAFEVWNEPGGGMDWLGTIQEYFQLYAHAARALKRVSPKLLVGGPAGEIGVAQALIAWCKNESVPIDFISTHVYSGGTSNVNNAGTIVQHMATAKPMAMEAGLFHIESEWGGSYKPGRSGNGTGGSMNPNTLPVSSWDGGVWRGEQQDTYETASFILSVILQSHEAGLTWGQHEATSFWDLTDVFEESGFPTQNSSFNGNFGLINVYGIPKPSYRAFQLLHELGDELLLANRTGGGNPNTPSDCAASVGVLASRSNASCLTVLVFSQATLGRPISPSCVVNITVNGGGDGGGDPPPHATAATTLQGTIRRIDETHTAPKAAWLAMGMPQWPSQAQNRELFEASIMQRSKLPITQSGSGVLSFNIDVAANSVVAVQIPLGGDLDLIEAEKQRLQRAVLVAAEGEAVQVAAKIAVLKAAIAAAPIQLEL